MQHVLESSIMKCCSTKESDGVKVAKKLMEVASKSKDSNAADEWSSPEDLVFSRLKRTIATLPALV